MKKKYARRYIKAYYKLGRGINKETGLRNYEKMELPNNWLYTDEWNSDRHYRTKLTPDDLPEWYMPIWQSPYIGWGYISTQCVSDLKWQHPNVDYDNHSFKDFRLMIAYDGKEVTSYINKSVYTFGYTDWKYDEALWGWDAVQFVAWCDEYSPITVDTSAAKEAMIAKYNAYIDVIMKEKEEFGWTHKITEKKVESWDELIEGLRKPGNRS